MHNKTHSESGLNNFRPPPLSRPAHSIYPPLRRSNPEIRHHVVLTLSCSLNPPPCPRSPLAPRRLGRGRAGSAYLFFTLAVTACMTSCLSGP